MDHDAAYADSGRGVSSGTSSLNLIRLRRGLVWLFLGLLALRFVLVWADTYAGASLPQIGPIATTAIFAAFSLLHAADRFGWRRALAFLCVCAVVSFGVEAFAVNTGSVVGAYHFSDTLGPQIAGVPVLVPFGWFMMCYASWIVSHVLLEGTGNPASSAAILARSVIAAATVTAWDVVMDPTQMRAGLWTWEGGGAFFGVPAQEFTAWMGTCLVIYLLVELLFRLMRDRASPRETSREIAREIPGAAARLFGGAPVLAYALVSIDQLLNTPFPELHVVAAFGMCLVALLALLRLALVQSPVALPGAID